MKGLRIDQLSGCPSFAQILEPLKDSVASLYWVIEEPAELFVFDGERYLSSERDCWVSLPTDPLEELIDREAIPKDRTFGVARPGYFPKFAAYVRSDWTLLVCVESLDDLFGLNSVDEDFASKKARLLFACIDGGYWEVYASRPEWLSPLKRTFPSSNVCVLSESRSSVGG